MESENGITMEEEIIVSGKADVEESAADEKKVEPNAYINGEEASNLKEDPKQQGTKSEGKASKAPANVSKSRISKTLKRSVLSQSLSFPARRVHGEAVVKSIDGYKEKADPKHAQEKSSKAHGSSSNGSVLSLSRLSLPNRRGSIHVNSKNANGIGATSRRTTLASLPSNKQAVPAKSGPGNVDAKPSSSSESADSKPITAAALSKEDDDAHSTTSATSRSTRRSSGSGFTFRLEERAEKRKEFLSKIEEKIHAKELEKNNLQEKSKENQEAEIKQLRKSLTFKATPMPSFYKEPPPKVEIKKIPTTRAISPKLGRNKSGAAPTNNPSEGDGSGISPSLNQECNDSTKRTQTNGNEDSVASKKTVKKPQPKLQPKETTKSEEKLGKSKPKTKKAENPVQDACVGKPEENQNDPINISQSEESVAIAEEINPTQNSGPIPSLANADIMPRQVTVGG
ncbi:Protein WVD2-like 1 [Hibiscus syriacus]|uniref:Protein WVD2-like 1 n=1 Tax=Hibiscus syriacus TaxID=106335 RepID=A0A6A2WG07_HIBSY|nr:protein WVD2-like 4 isoform X1 [Hibiscus syriacus]XP_039051468.1 protein WVD2-like 4 isoform X1 [Hibiscus syriacus]KAE8657772.1 Protein WVD2-like 1 [Hibiscus syriacus]